MEKLNERVRELRKELNLTLDKFGERIGLKKSALSLIENGKNGITDQVFKSICREFNVNDDWLRTGEGDMFNLPLDETAYLVADILDTTNPLYDLVLSIIKIYQQLDINSREVVDDVIQKLLDDVAERKKEE